jgi:hypothetical protein
MEQENISTVQQEPSLKDLFKSFTGEIAKASNYRRELLEKQKTAHNEYYKTLNECQELVELGEVEKAAEVDIKLKDLRNQIENYRLEVEKMGDLDKLKEIVSRHPDSRLHQQALSIHQEALSSLEIAQGGFNEAVQVVAELKDSYLKGVEKAGSMQRELFDAFIIIKKVEEFLPDDKKLPASKRPNALNWTDFEIDEKELCRVFGRKPFINP